MAMAKQQMQSVLRGIEPEGFPISVQNHSNAAARARMSAADTPVSSRYRSGSVSPSVPNRRTLLFEHRPSLDRTFEFLSAYNSAASPAIADSPETIGASPKGGKASKRKQSGTVESGIIMKK